MNINDMVKRYFNKVDTIYVSFIICIMLSLVSLLITNCNRVEIDSNKIIASSNTQQTNNFLLYQAHLTPSDLYLFNLQNLSSRFLREGQIVQGQPWSPDGTKFIFNPNPSYRDNAQFPLSIYDWHSAHITELDLRIPARSTAIFWSPDGQKLFYAIGFTTNPPIQMIVYDLVTGENEIIAEVFNESAAIFSLAGWSPDSQKFAFITKLNGQIDLYTLDVRSAKVEQLTNSPEIEVLASWSPVENHLLVGITSSTDEAILYVPPGQAEELHLIDESGQRLPFPGESFRGVSTVAWSPHGQKIAYSIWGKLCILEIDSLSSSCPLELRLPSEVYSTAFATPATWSADSQWLAFRTSNRDEVACHVLYVYEIAVGRLQEIKDGSCYNSPAYWSRQ